MPQHEAESERRLPTPLDRTQNLLGGISGDEPRIPNHDRRGTQTILDGNGETELDNPVLAPWESIAHGQGTPPQQEKPEHHIPLIRGHVTPSLFGRTGAAARQVRGNRLAALQSRGARRNEVVRKRGERRLFVQDPGGHTEGNDTQNLPQNLSGAVTKASALVDAGEVRWTEWDCSKGQSYANSGLLGNAATRSYRGML